MYLFIYLFVYAFIYLFIYLFIKRKIKIKKDFKNINFKLCSLNNFGNIYVNFFFILYKTNDKSIYAITGIY